VVIVTDPAAIAVLANELRRMVGPQTVRLSEVDPEHVSWLWPGYLPRGKLVILDGDPGVAKSTLTLDLAARVSTGAPMPDGSGGGPPADVLLLSAEDGLADTIRPRLDAAGADVRRVHALTDVAELRDDQSVKKRPPSLPADLPHIETVIAEHRVALVVVDVLMAYLGGAVDSHRDQDVRGVLHQLAGIADRRGCTIILIRHLNKTGGAQAIYRGGGSIGIAGAARAAFLAALDPDDEAGARRVFAPVKCNLGPKPPALSYVLVSDPARGCAAVEWTGPTEHRADDLLRQRGDDEERTERDEAADWLAAYLEVNGPSRAADVKRAARADGIAERTLARARQKLGVTVKRLGFQQPVEWSLDASRATPDASRANRASTPNPGTAGTTETTAGTTEGESP
jgi:hypothetical protein